MGIEISSDFQEMELNHHLIINLSIEQLWSSLLKFCHLEIPFAFLRPLNFSLSAKVMFCFFNYLYGNNICDFEGTTSGNTLPQPCSLLSVGQAFSGTQNVSSLQKDEAWRVNVRIQGCDLDHGYLCGTMEALNVPMADTPVVTFWEGEIVDTKNYTFFTGKWGATQDDDIKHWTEFPSFPPLLSQVEADGGKSLDLSNYPFIFMRWKEQHFVNVRTECGLTIAGFYYVCFSCSDGSINGFYYDPNSSPFQKLELKSTNDGRLGFSFSRYELQ